ncbi:MAG: Uma2 family endonuclease [Acidobacteriota bacterium]|nr:Uma2 family endonuclease [Acidobacteriota bacterium]
MPTTERETRLTYDDFVRFPDDGLRHELIDGVHYVTPSPATRHQQLSGRLHLAIGIYLEAHPEAGHVFYAPFDVIFSRWDVVEPDLLFIAADQLEILTHANVQGAPALVVEILSPGTRKRDLGIKRALFERGGVREYWVVDSKAEDVAIYRRDAASRLVPLGSLKAVDGSVLATPLLPGFELPLAKLFAPLLPDRG